jgi:hypothetical protein
MNDELEEIWKQAIEFYFKGIIPAFSGLENRD